MSLPKSATRRVALFTSSSLVAAGIAAAASLGLALTPGAAAAQAVCSETQAQVSDAPADTVTCPVGTYPTGINYTSTGDLSVSVQMGGPSTFSNFGTGGIVGTAGTAPDDVTLRLIGGVPSGSTISFNTPFPALLNAESQSGDVLVEVEAQILSGTTFGPTVSASNAATTRAVRAVSTGGGDVIVRGRVRGSTGIANGTIQSNVNPNAVAIEARSVGGGDVTVDLDLGTARGRLYGILAQADGDGDVTIRGSAIANTSVAGSAGLRVIAGVGDVDIVGGQSPGTTNAFEGRTGVFVDTSGNVDFTGRATGTVYGIDIANVAAGTTATLNLVGNRSSQGFVNATTGGTAAIRAQGAGDVAVNIVGVQSAMNFDFTGLSGTAAVNVKSGGAWAPAGNASTTISGNFDISIEEGGALISGFQSSGAETATVLTFANPAMSLTNAGYILIGPGDASLGGNIFSHEAELRLVGVSEFRNSGDIVLGGCGLGCSSPTVTPVRIGGAVVDATDGWYDDMFVFQNGNWIGEGGRILFDVDTNRVQTSCTREAVTFDFGAADCVRIVNSTVEGVTYVNVTELLPGDRGRLTQQSMDNGIVLIETPGSTVTAENFALDPGMDDYNATAQSLDKGLFQYVLLFDEEDSQFRLHGTLSGAAYQLPMAATVAHNMWRLSTGSWLNRQADLRGSMPEELGGGIWLRASGEQTDRDIDSVSILGGLPFTVDNTHRADTYAINGGVDIFSGSDGNLGYVVGMTAGYAHTDVEYDASPNTQAMDAWTGGLYGGLVIGQLFVDAIVNANNVIIDTDAPGFNFQPEGTILSSRMISLGGQVEAGWRMLFDGGFFAEPLASVSYVRSRMEDLQIVPDDASRPGLEVSFEDPSSLRAGLGGRFGIDSNVADMRTQLSLLARTWTDLEGRNTASIHNQAFPDDPDIRVVDEFSDQFHEVAVGASLWSPNGIVSGFLNVGGKFGEDYEAKTGSVGVRVAW